MPRVYAIPGRRRGEALVNTRTLYRVCCTNVCSSVFPFNLTRRGDGDGDGDDNVDVDVDVDNLERRIYSI